MRERRGWVGGGGEKGRWVAAKKKGFEFRSNREGFERFRGVRGTNNGFDFS
jgi:hypothetical protein